MSAPEKCPKCESGLSWPIRDGHANYICGSFMVAEGGFAQDVRCVSMAKVTAPLREERDALRAEVYRLKAEYADLCLLIAKARLSVQRHKPALLSFAEWQQIGGVLKRAFPAPTNGMEVAE
jgi:hypothetical protein